jgi:hypothetical protein
VIDETGAKTLIAAKQLGLQLRHVAHATMGENATSRMHDAAWRLTHPKPFLTFGNAAPSD